jgi:hypothetical protein
MALLSDLVRLFRAVNLPDIDESYTFTAQSFEFTNDAEEALSSIFSARAAEELGIEIRFGEIRVTRESDFSILKSKVGEIADVLSVQLPRRGAHQFYLTLEDFISRVKSINIGEIPDNFYVVNLDYYHGGTELHKRPEVISKVEYFCEFIQLIKKSCNFVETDFASSYKAVFVVSEEKTSEMIPRTVSLSFPVELMKCDLINLDLLREIVNSDVSETHREEKLSTFRLSLWETISKSKSGEPDILYLAKHWEDLIGNYNATYSLYIRGFSFSKFKMEIQEFIHDSIVKANSLLGDIVLKTLSIPSIFAVWLYLTRSPRFDEYFSLGLCVAVLFSSLIVIFAIDNQQFLVGQLKTTTENTLGQFSKTTKNVEKFDNQEIDKLIVESSVTINKRLENIGIRLLAMRVSVWLFVISSVIITSYLSWPYESSYMATVTLITLLVVMASYLSRLIYRRCANNEHFKAAIIKSKDYFLKKP